MSRRAEGISITESNRTRSCLVGRAVAATGASVFDFHGSRRRKLIILGRGRDRRKFRGKRWKESWIYIVDREKRSSLESRTFLPPLSTPVCPWSLIDSRKNKCPLFSNGSIGKRDRELSLRNNYCSGVTCTLTIASFFLFFFFFCPSFDIFTRK